MRAKTAADGLARAEAIAIDRTNADERATAEIWADRVRRTRSECERPTDRRAELVRDAVQDLLGSQSVPPV
jgi:hypothetical protein